MPADPKYPELAPAPISAPIPVRMLVPNFNYALLAICAGLTAIRLFHRGTDGNWRWRLSYSRAVLDGP